MFENHVDEYDPENPPLTDEELSRFRHHKDIPPEIEIMARVKAAEEKMKMADKKNSDSINKSQSHSDKYFKPKNRLTFFDAINDIYS